MSIAKYKVAFIVFASTICYLISIALSCGLYQLHTPNLIQSYITLSGLQTFAQYSYPIFIWVIIGVIFVYLKCSIKNNKKTESDKDYRLEQQRKTKQNAGILIITNKQAKLIWALMLTFIFFHSFIALNKCKQNHSSIYKQFKFGKRHMDKQNKIYTSNYDKSWPGWSYYFSDEYYQQTKKRLQNYRAQKMDFQQFQLTLTRLKDLHNGIYSVKSWLTNHRLIYDILSIGYKSIGILFLFTIWLFSIFHQICRSGLICNCCNTLTFLIFWILIAAFGSISQFAHSIVVLNHHSICLDQPNSGVVNIIINKKSVEYISELQLNVIQDPNNIYRNVCNNMQKFYNQPLQIDQEIIKHVFNLSFFGFAIVFIAEILCLAYSRNRGIQYKDKDVTIEQQQSIDKNYEASDKKVYSIITQQQ